MTRFFRDTLQFDVFRRTLQLLPAEALGDGVDVWCVGCSTGEEAYSIAMVCAEVLPAHARWAVIGTDIKAAALRTARKGMYAEGLLQEIPEAPYHRYITRCENGQFGISAKVARGVRFACHDVSQTGGGLPCAAPRSVFMRNVLPYLNADGKRAALQKAWSSLLPGGVLFVGRSEDLTEWRSELQNLEEYEINGSTYYMKKST
jgi:chemotaxis methyl-accepting protein methylase